MDETLSRGNPELTKQDPRELPILFEDSNNVVVVPSEPLVPSSEGVSLTVTPKTETAPYYDPESKIKETLDTFITALAAGRSVMGEHNLYSQWVNIHLLPRFGTDKHFQIEVVGRNAAGDTWGQPVDYPQTDREFGQHSVVRQEIDMIQRNLPENLTRVVEEAQSVTLFDKPGIENTIEAHKDTVFQFQNFEIRMPSGSPHVLAGGLHLWIHSTTPEKHEGVQSNVKNGLEQFILASAVAKVVKRHLDIPIEIHFSGNWGLAMPNNPQENLSAHANLYGAPPGTNRVELPPRPGYDKLKGNDELRPAQSQETRAQIIVALNEDLLDYVDEFVGKNASGIINQEQNHETGN